MRVTAQALIKQHIEILNELGLHARAAAKLVRTAEAFSSRITLDNGEIEANAKGIMSLMMLAAIPGTHLTLTVEGEDEEQAAAEIVQLINDRFGEES